MSSPHRPLRLRESSARLGASTLAVLALGALSAGAAGAATHRAAAHRVTERGAVIARDPSRHTIVIASGGTAHTLRFAAARPVAATRLGSTLHVVALPLADGTAKVVSDRATGRTHRVRLRATVVQSSATRLVLSAGGSVFAVQGVEARRAVRHTHLAPSSPHPGEVVDATLQLSSTSVQPANIQPVGQANLVDLEGVLSQVTADSLVVTVSAGAITTIAIPPALSLPATIAVGDQVQVVAAYSSGSFSLVTIVDDTLAATSSSAATSTVPADGSSDQVEVEGLVVSAPAGDGAPTSSTSLTGTATSVALPAGSSTLTGTATTLGTLVIQPGDNAAPVSLTVPAGFALPVLAAGMRVHAVGALQNGTLTLVRLHLQSPAGADASGDHGRGTPAPCPPSTANPNANGNGNGNGSGNGNGNGNGNDHAQGHGGDHAVGADHGGGGCDTAAGTTPGAGTSSATGGGD